MLYTTIAAVSDDEIALVKAEADLPLPPLVQGAFIINSLPPELRIYVLGKRALGCGVFGVGGGGRCHRRLLVARCRAVVLNP